MPTNRESWNLVECFKATGTIPPLSAELQAIPLVIHSYRKNAKKYRFCKETIICSVQE